MGPLGRSTRGKFKSNVIPQVEVGSPGNRYRIDLVVEGMKGRLAVECDGDRWHGIDRWERDRERQEDLERAGWTFFRLRASTFYRNREKALEPLWQKLEEMGIEPRRRLRKVSVGVIGGATEEDLATRALKSRVGIDQAGFGLERRGPMWLLRQVVEVVLLLAQGLYKALFEAPDFKSLELAMERLAQEATRRLLVMALEAKDRWLMEQRDRRLRLVDADAAAMPGAACAWWSGGARPRTIPCSGGTRSRSISSATSWRSGEAGRRADEAPRGTSPGALAPARA